MSSALDGYPDTLSTIMKHDLTSMLPIVVPKHSHHSPTAYGTGDEIQSTSPQPRGYHLQKKKPD
ncbi:hypothetical protein Scep_021637 [Stephania cephalantha]|uniref:Uncharacterized protein n=1 Tax=Stephania cephalantha TaxID=152367 RepID=A0AAP0F8W3_9MAGN